MPLRDYVQSVRGALHRGPDSGSSSSAAAQILPSGSAKDGVRQPLRGDLPSDKLFISDACLAALVSTAYRPYEKMTGEITALHGALGVAGGYSILKVDLHVLVRLVKTSREESYATAIGETQMPMWNSYDVDTFEERMIKVTGQMLYDYKKEGARQGKETIMPFQLSIPPEAEGFQLAPNLPKYIEYFLCISAAEFDTGHWRKLYLDNLKFRPRDDALASLDSLSMRDPFLMIGPYQELELAKQPRWGQYQDALPEVPCPLLRKRKVAVQEAEGTIVVRVHSPEHDLFVQRPFPLVIKLSAIAPASYTSQDADWASFRLKIPAGASDEKHEVQTWIKMAVPNARGGDGIVRLRLALMNTGKFLWDPVHPGPKEARRSSEKPRELEHGLDWSEPQLEPPISRHAGRWASHAFVKGAVKMSKNGTTSFNSREGDFEIYNTIDLIFWPQGKYLGTRLIKATRELSQPIQEEEHAEDCDQPPPYST